MAWQHSPGSCSSASACFSGSRCSISTAGPLRRQAPRSDLRGRSFNSYRSFHHCWSQPFIIRPASCARRSPGSMSGAEFSIASLTIASWPTGSTSPVRSQSCRLAGLPSSGGPLSSPETVSVESLRIEPLKRQCFAENSSAGFHSLCDSRPVINISEPGPSSECTTAVVPAVFNHV